MPNSRYPQPGHPIGPQILASYLEGSCRGPDSSAIQPMASELAAESVSAEPPGDGMDCRPLAATSLPSVQSESTSGEGLCVSWESGQQTPPRYPGVRPLTFGQLYELLEGADWWPAPPSRAHKETPSGGYDDLLRLLELVERGEVISDHYLHLPLLSGSRGANLELLGLCNRAESALRKACLTAGPSQGADLTIAKLHDIDGVDRTCLINLLECLCIAKEPRRRSRIASEIGERLSAELTELIQHLGVPAISTRDPRFGDLLIAAFVQGDLFEANENGDPTGGTQRALQALCHEVSSKTKLTVDLEVIELAFPKASPRNLDMALSYYGLRGEGPSTLEEIGKRFRVTRERVRQICLAVRRGRTVCTAFAPVLDSAIRLIREMVPCKAADAEAKLVSTGLARLGMSVEAILKTAPLLARASGISIERQGSARYVVAADQKLPINRIRAAARHLVSQLGCASLDLLEERISLHNIRARTLATLRDVVQSIDGFRWLDESLGWFWISTVGRNSLRRKIRQVLAVAPMIRISELRTALRKDYRARPVLPPTPVLMEFCHQIRGCKVQGSMVIVNHPEDPLRILRGNERTLVQLLMEHGPICRRDELQERATHAGVSGPSFWRCLNYCPTIMWFARGVYGLTGAAAPPGLVESLGERSKPPARVVEDHGWTENGRVWVAYRVSGACLLTGVAGVPTGKRPLLQGTYALQTREGNDDGKLVVREGSLWGLGPAFRRLGVEEGDILVVEFGLRERVALLRVGDDGLLDELQGDN
jgi:hypothetical protein